MNGQAITVTTKAKTAKAAKAKATPKTKVVEEAEDISSASSDELEDTDDVKTPEVKPKLVNKLEKRFAHLDELHAGLYEGESDSEWEDADRFDDEDEEEEARKEEREKINEMVDEARAITEQMIKDLDAKMEAPVFAIRSLKKSVHNLTRSVDQLKRGLSHSTPSRQAIPTRRSTTNSWRKSRSIRTLTR